MRCADASAGATPRRGVGRVAIYRHAGVGMAEVRVARVILPGSRSPQDPIRLWQVRSKGLPKSHSERIQRERLIDAFVQVCAKEGYENAGVRATCKAAGVAYNTFYEHFEGKEELLLAAYDAGVSQLFAGVADAFSEARDKPWETRVATAIDVFLQILVQNPAFARFFVVEAVKAGSTAIAHIDESVQHSFVVFGGAAPREGLNLQTQDIMPLAVGGIFQTLYRTISAGDMDRLGQLGPILSEFVFNMLEPAGEPSDAE